MKRKFNKTEISRAFQELSKKYNGVPNLNEITSFESPIQNSLEQIHFLSHRVSDKFLKQLNSIAKTNGKLKSKVSELNVLSTALETELAKLQASTTKEIVLDPTIPASDALLPKKSVTFKEEEEEEEEEENLAIPKLTIPSEQSSEKVAQKSISSKADLNIEIHKLIYSLSTTPWFQYFSEQLSKCKVGIELTCRKHDKEVLAERLLESLKELLENGAMVDFKIAGEYFIKKMIAEHEFSDPMKMIYSRIFENDFSDDSYIEQLYPIQGEDTTYSPEY